MDFLKRIEIKAHELFTKNGIQKTSLVEIAIELGIDRTVIIDLFENKDALVENFVQKEISMNEEFCEALVKTCDNAIIELLYIITYIKSFYEIFNHDIIKELKENYRYAYWLLSRHKSGFLYQSINKNLQRGINENLYRAEFNPGIVGRFILENILMLSDTDISGVEKPIEEMFYFLANALTTVEGAQFLESHKNISFDKVGANMAY